MFFGQAAQFVGMGRDIFDASPDAAALFRKADDILGFKLTEIMFSGTADGKSQRKLRNPRYIFIP